MKRIAWSRVARASAATLALFTCTGCSESDPSTADDGPKPTTKTPDEDPPPMVEDSGTSGETPMTEPPVAQMDSGGPAPVPPVDPVDDPEAGAPPVDDTEVDAGEPEDPPDAGDGNEPPEMVNEPPVERCTHTSPAEPPGPVIPDAGERMPDVSIRENAFVGDYLVDSFGKPLYIYTADLPGDCMSPPVSVCVDRCEASWPVYFAGERQLGEGVDDSLFGTIVRADGSKQTTYDGWPIYTFKSDNKPETPDGFISGHGKRGLWMAARVNSYNVVVMVPESDRKRRYLATGLGQTLYSYDQDTVGDDGPVSACVGQCRAKRAPLRLRHVSPFGELLPEDFTVFRRAEGGGTQVAYKGKPLYWSKDDLTRGDITGEGDGWATVEP